MKTKTLSKDPYHREYQSDDGKRDAMTLEINEVSNENVIEIFIAFNKTLESATQTLREFEVESAYKKREESLVMHCPRNLQNHNL